MTAAEIMERPSKKEVISSPQSRKLRIQERIAKGIIWFLAMLTIAVLAWIVGYLMVRGIRYNNHVPYGVTTSVETQLELPGMDDDVVFIIHYKTRSEDIPVTGLRKLYNKVRKENWGFYNQQNLKVTPFAYKGAGAFSKSVEEFLLTGSDLSDYRENVKDVSSWKDMVSHVGSTPGSLGFIPASEASNLPSNVKILGVRRIALAVHPSVLEIQDGKMMREISSENVDRIINGEVSNWQEVGGTDLPLTVIEHDDSGNYIEELQNTSGAVVLCHFSDIEQNELSTIPVLRHETGWNLTWHFIVEAPARSGQWGGISYIILNTFFLILFTVLFSTPVGIMAAIYMVEYTNQGRMMRILRMGTETLAGIPSIVFGLFGFIFFVQILGMGIGFISSTLTITLMVLPTIIRTSEEALKSVPQSFREGSLALGASKLQTIVKVVLPAASPGILTGIILSIGRTVGETAVLIYTLGSNYDLVSGPSSSARVLSLHLYMLFSEALSFDRTFATGAVLVIIILMTNLSATYVMKRVNKNSGYALRS
ncbi:MULTISPECIES: phosphate ABC transporter permease PstA [unclassified Oceanispirochaeta]|uniref:phosphate ABC transporter permease PstA n=1 Tax=unclassified Oceanispirochaeta TaxID=2635722 RepID=UPI001E5FCA58|nr:MULTISPECIES: phosphate ABC transporter permease PstA [unclassified Oceanispirochaeta]